MRAHCSCCPLPPACSPASHRPRESREGEVVRGGRREGKGDIPHVVFEGAAAGGEGSVEHVRRRARARELLVEDQPMRGLPVSVDGHQDLARLVVACEPDHVANAPLPAVRARAVPQPPPLPVDAPRVLVVSDARVGARETRHEPRAPEPALRVSELFNDLQLVVRLEARRTASLVAGRAKDPEPDGPVVGSEHETLGVAAERDHAWPARPRREDGLCAGTLDARIAMV
mmetsp:Transcript_57961/g.136091  ORF Transcript_57961/g.136091 Transcript_57961/m.136091 type:complete len:229 (+) Transcript_57961:184-870(+)